MPFTFPQNRRSRFTIQVPVRKLRQLERYTEETQALDERLQRPPNADEVAQALGLQTEDVLLIERIQKLQVRLLPREIEASLCRARALARIPHHRQPISRANCFPTAVTSSQTASHTPYARASLE